MKTYRTRFSLWLVALIVIISFVVIIPLKEAFASDKASEIYRVFGMILVYFVMIIGALYTTYTIDPLRQQLIISNFFGLAKRRYDIMKMCRIRNSRSLWSAPASSIRRICIEQSNMSFRHNIIISPYMQDEFIAELRSVNPKIEDLTHQ